MYKTSRAKIIPFPGVPLNINDNFQNVLDDFLKEIGYIEAPEVRGCQQTNSIKKELEYFLQEMGYVE